MIVSRRSPLAIHAAVLAAAWIAAFGPGSSAVAADEAAPGPAAADRVVAEIRTPEGFHTTLFASEPDVQQPIGIATDERGRLWVAENYTYADQATNFDLTKRDRIVILEDSDGDGQSDRRTVFWDQAQKLTSVEIGYGGVWALCAPHLLFIPDRNRDDVPDGPPEVVLDGWDQDAVRHNIVNGLRWGPDGWLYGRHGILATSLVGRPGAAESQRQRINCGVWRYHPTRRLFEVVAQGTTNPWGFDFDQHGEMFFINTVIGHLWHLVPGAHYERMYGADFNPHLYELIGQTADHVHWDTGEKWSDIRLTVSDTTSAAGGGHAHCGLMIYQGDNWPDRYRNTMFTLNFHGRRLNNDRLERRGAGYVGLHGDDLFFVPDPWFRGIDLTSGADGAAYIADWSDAGECHEADGVHHASGRIYRLAWGETPRREPFDLCDRTNLELVELQLATNDWYVRQSRRLLAERHAAGQQMDDARAALLQMFNSQSDQTRQLRAMWTLAVIGAADDQWLQRQLTQPGEHVRVWAIQLLADRETLSDATIACLAKLAATESAGLVRLYLASALQRMAPAARWSVAKGLAMRLDDASDPRLPLMIWYGLEPAVAADPHQALQLCEASIMPLLRRHIARRVASEIDHNPDAMNQLIVVASELDDPANQLDMLRGASEALHGRRNVRAPAAWNGAVERFLNSAAGDVQAAAQELGVAFSDRRAIDTLRSIVLDESASVTDRRRAIRTLTQVGGLDMLELLLTMSKDAALASDAIRGLATFDDARIPDVVIASFPSLDETGQAAAVDALASRPASAHALLRAVDAALIPKTAISASQARQIAALNDPALTADLERLWGTVRATADDKLQQIDRLRIILEGGKLAAGDASRGRVLFDKACTSCHVLYGQGKLIGPDLTGSNRHNLNYLLENVVDPSASVGAEFRTSAILLSSGQAVSGVVVAQGDRTITLQTPTEQIAIDRDEVEEMVEQPLSLMPDGLLTPLSDDQIADLFAYLQSTSQVELPNDE
ncbi:MAG: c-type cytochrome [Planctomycetaceae bacterium]|nr:c-type cytochrome [Planctomycetaceae bacterium]